MLVHPSYTDDISFFSISNHDNLVFIGKKYFYEINTSKEFNEAILEVQKKTPLEVSFEPYNLSLDENISAEIHFVYQLSKLDAESIELLKSVGFFTYPKTVINDNEIHLIQNFIGTRHDITILPSKFHLLKTRPVIVYEEVSDERKSVNQVIKPLTTVVDLIILVPALIIYAFQGAG